MEIFTIGTSGTNGRRFIENLSEVAASAVIDTRVHPNSQLAGFAKQDNLEYLIELTIGVPLIHAQAFCPPEELLREYRAKKIDWEEYEVAYLQCLKERGALDTIDSSWGSRPVLVCSEPKPHHCHRRLAAEFISNAIIDVKITHLLH